MSNVEADQNSTNESSVDTSLISPKKAWLPIGTYKVFQLLAVPYKIYFKQFFKFFLLSLLAEFAIFGVLQLVLFEISYNFVLDSFDIGLDFANEYAAGFFFPLLFLIAILFVIRSVVNSHIAAETIEDSRANIFRAIDATVRKTGQVFFVTLFFVIILILPGIFFFLGNLLLIRGMVVLGWLVIITSVAVPLFFGSRICYFVPAFSRSNYSLGEGIQRSWKLSSDLLLFKTFVILSVIALLNIALPWFLTIYFSPIYGFWFAFGMVFVRALLYPIFDITITLTFLDSEIQSLNKAVFREEILERRQLSEKFYQNK